MVNLFGEAEVAPAEPPPVPEGPGLFGDAAPVAQAAPGYRVLARKYRPQDFAALIGQEAMVRTLTNAFALNRIAHAFMLTGVRGVGKTTTARIIARALNCTGADDSLTRPTITPCGVCASCRAIAEDRHQDVIEIDAASNTGVDDAREIIEQARYRPMGARRKVFIIDEVHMMTKNAFNALLKTLEEPPDFITFIFATTELRKVPVTVLSRCQRFDLRRIDAAGLAAHYARIAAQESVVIEDGAVRLIARAADGSVRDGLSLLDQAIALAGDAPIAEGEVREMLGLADRLTVFDLFQAVVEGRIADALALFASGTVAGADPAVVLTDLLGATHTVTRLKLVPALADQEALAEAERTRGAELAAKLSVPELTRVWQMLLKGIAELNDAPDRNAAGEMVLIRVAHAASLPTPGDLVRRLTSEATFGAGPATPPSPRPGGLRAIAGGGVVAAALPAPATATPAITGLAQISALALAANETLLAANIDQMVHLVRIEDGLLEFRPERDAPRDLASRIAVLLSQATGKRWTVAVSDAEGAPTLDQQKDTAKAVVRAEVEAHPLVRAIMDAFPGATIETIHEAIEPAAVAGITEDQPPEDDS